MRFVRYLYFYSFALLCLSLHAQVVPGVATDLHSGAAFPTHAKQYSAFVLTSGGTPVLYICNNNPCMVSGDWVTTTSSASPGGSNQQMQFNNSTSFGGACGVKWNSGGLAFNIAACAAATISANVPSSSLNIVANYWAGVSTPDTWTLEAFAPGSGGGNHSVLQLSHTGLNAAANTSNFIFAIEPQATAGTNLSNCGHDDLFGFTTNTVVCLSVAGSNVSSSNAGVDISVSNTSSSTNGRTRLLQSIPLLGFTHQFATDPNGTYSKEEGARACGGGANCYDWMFLSGVAANLAELYLGGDAWTGASGAAMKIDVSTAGGGGARTGIKFFGALSFSSLLISPTAPTIASGFGTSPSITQQNGTAAFEVNVGTGGTATSGVIALPAAANGWSCQASDMNTPAKTTTETTFTTTSVTLTAISAWTASDNLLLNCTGF